MLAALAALAAASAGALAPGTAAFVVEGTASMRAAPGAAAAVVRQLPIWTAVRVDTVEHGWARVLAGPRVLVYDSPGGEARPVAPSTFSPSAPAGWLPVASLDPAPPSRRALLTAARAASDDTARRVLLLRAWALDPHDPAVVSVAAPAARSRVLRRAAPFARADLVFGCHGDLARARVASGVLLGRRPGAAPTGDVCLERVDVRTPCDDERRASHRREAGELTARFGAHGPALRLEAGPGAGDLPIYVVTRLLAADGCAGDVPLAASTDVKVERLRVPVIEHGGTTLHVLVPRYGGALYDVVAADSAADVDGSRESFELGPDFDVDPRLEPGPGHHLFVAPDACCAAEDEP